MKSYTVCAAALFAVAVCVLSARAETMQLTSHDTMPADPLGKEQVDPLRDYDNMAATPGAGYFSSIILPDEEINIHVSVGYHARTGELWVEAPDEVELTSITIDSTIGIFTGGPAQNLGGFFDISSPNKIFKATFGTSFGSISFGNVTKTGLSRDMLLADLTIDGSLAGGGGLRDVGLIYVPVPEPLGSQLLVLGLLSLMAACRNSFHR
jgi:hypothetical protein